ncbi:MAG: SigE family RNA polymerase sigma factor [Actinophytocola sp.]|uniref:SigE family RNA polymerase sigma factor n=1 Tax=Actinophytocola sp. TaxID=1872138 RepID=UPI003C762402
MSPRDRSDDERFHVFATRSTASLTRLAYLLCGDQHLAHDLVQTCLIRLYQAWPKVRDKDAADPYARKVLLRCWLNERRRPWRRAESQDGHVPDTPAPERDPAGVMHQKEVIRVALAKLPPRQRAAVVLRYWSQHTVTETATILRCSEGNVKSQSARGLAALRAALAGLDAEALKELKS